jgi:hypothetical protein
MLSEALHVDRDMDNLEPERDNPLGKDPSEPPLQEPETPPHSPPPHHTTIPPCAGPAKEQGENLEPAEEYNADTVVVECAVSDRGESSDDSEDKDYVEEEPLPVAKRRRVRFVDTVRRYAPDEPHELPMSPADTLDNESQGSSPDVACIHEEIPVSGVLTLREVHGRMQYSLTFSQDLMPCVLRQDKDTRCSSASSVQRRGGVRRARYKFTEEDDKNIIKMKRRRASRGMRLAEEISGSTKGSIQVHYSTTLKYRKGIAKRVSKRRRVE